MIAKLFIRPLIWVLIFSLALPVGGLSQGDAEAPAVFRQEELDQMLAPIALYPDSLLVQILMAATYPLEVVAAARWVKANPDLKDDRLAEAMEQRDWDPSVKSLVNVPSVLDMMNERLDWMQKLGDAFLAQEEQIMATVQTLREKAYTQGSLRTSGNQHVVVQEKVIIVEPANPDVIAVPVYDPYVVYGPWWYPAYPPYAFYPPGFIVGSSVLFFGTGVFFGAAWGYAWGGFDWHHHHCFINVNQHIRFNRHIDRGRFADRFAAGPDGRSRWTHDPVHRKGVIYRDRTTRERFGQVTRPGAGARQEFRGRFPDGGKGGQGASIAPPWSGRGVHPAAAARPPAGLGISPVKACPEAAVLPSKRQDGLLCRRPALLPGLSARWRCRNGRAASSTGWNEAGVRRGRAVNRAVKAVSGCLCHARPSHPGAGACAEAVLEPPARGEGE